MRLKKRVVIVGNGGFAHETKFIIERLNEVHEEWEFLGYIDHADGENVIGSDDFIINSTSELAVVIAIGDPDIRERLWNAYKTNVYVSFPNIIDPSVIVHKSLKSGRGNIICANSILTTDVSIGNFNIVNLSCTIGHNVEISDFCIINPGSNISGDVRIKNYCSIGTGVKVIQGVTINEQVIVGAGAVVIENLPANCTAVGVPTRVIKRRDI